MNVIIAFLSSQHDIILSERKAPKERNGKEKADLRKSVRLVCSDARIITVKSSGMFAFLCVTANDEIEKNASFQDALFYAVLGQMLYFIGR